MRDVTTKNAFGIILIAIIFNFSGCTNSDGYIKSNTQFDQIVATASRFYAAGNLDDSETLITKHINHWENYDASAWSFSHIQVERYKRTGQVKYLKDAQRILSHHLSNPYLTGEPRDRLNLMAGFIDGLLLGPEKACRQPPPSDNSTCNCDSAYKILERRYSSVGEFYSNALMMEMQEVAWISNEMTSSCPGLKYPVLDIGATSYFDTNSSLKKLRGLLSERQSTSEVRREICRIDYYDHSPLAEVLKEENISCP